MLAWAALILFTGPAVLIALHYGVLTCLGRRGRAPTIDSGLRHSFVILIPAHDEERTLPGCLRSIPHSAKTHTVVVADNCMDGTAQVAGELGAVVVVRNHRQLIGKGYALAFGMPAAMAHRPDAILILDADCELPPGILTEFDRALNDGHAVIQAPLEVRHSQSHPSEYVAAVGAEIDAAVHRGRSRLGGTVPLRGTGMLFRQDVLERHPWSMHGLAEDAEFSAVLKRAGIRVALLPHGSILTEAPHTAGGLLQQRRRWRAALTVPGLGWAERILTSKPLILLHLLAAVVAAFAVDLLEIWKWAVLAALGATVLVYLRAMVAVGFRWPGIAGAVLVGRLAAVTVAGFWTRESTWKRTARR